LLTLFFSVVLSVAGAAVTPKCHLGYGPGGVKRAVIQGDSGGAWNGKVIEPARKGPFRDRRFGRPRA
jgi:hypothetical protein